MGLPTVLLIMGLCSTILGLGLKSHDVNDTETARQRQVRGFLKDHFITKLNIVSQKLGIIECAGADTLTGGTLFKEIMGPEADFGGDYLCGPTCAGECMPYEKISVGPITAYPFGCKCPAARCTAEDGPIIHPLVRPIFKVVCVRDKRCTCEGMDKNKDGAFEPQTGYLCNWLNLNLNQSVSYTDTPDSSHNINPTYSPIRWCSCCPNE